MPPLQMGGYRYRKRKNTARKPSKTKYGGSRKRAIRKTKRRRNIKGTKRNKQR